MRALLITSFDAAPQLTALQDRLPGRGEVRLRIMACGLNFADLLMMQGRYQDMPGLPFTPGLELSGIIEAVGPETRSLPVGKGRRDCRAGRGGGMLRRCCAPSSCSVRPSRISRSNSP